MLWAGALSKELVHNPLVIVMVTGLKHEPDLFKASLQSRMGPAAWGKSQTC